MYSALLGIGANILNFYNNISSAFGSGIQGALTAVAAFGAQFYNIAKIVTTVLRLIKAHYVATGKEITAVQSLENKLRTNQDLSEEDRKLLEKYKQNEKYQKRLTALEAQYEKVRTGQAIQNENTKLGLKARMGNFFRSNGKQIAYGAGAVGSMIGTMVGGQAGNWITASSGVAGAIGAFAMHDYIGGAMSLVTAMPALVSAITEVTKVTDKYSESIEKAKKAQEKADESAKKAESTKQEIEDLEDLKEELETVTRNRYNSVESQEEYYTYMQKITEQYPTLISYYDDENRAIIDGTDAIKDRIEEEKKLYKTQAREAYFDKLKVDKTVLDTETYTNEELSSNDIAAMDNILESARLGQDTRQTLTTDKNFEQSYHFLHNDNDLDLERGSLPYVMADMFESFMYNNRKNLSDTDFSEFFGYDLDDDDRELKDKLYQKTVDNKELKGLYKKVDGYDDLVGGFTYSGNVDEVFRMLAYTLVERLQEADPKDYETVFYKFRSEFFGEYAEEGDYLSYFFQNARKYTETDAYQSRIDQLKEGAELYVDQLEGIQNYTELEKSALVDELIEDYKANNDKSKVLGQTQEQFAKSVEIYLNEVDEGLSQKAENLHKNYYGKANETQIGNIQAALDHLGDYTEEQIDDLIEGIENTEGGKAFKAKYDDYFDAASERYQQALSLLQKPLLESAELFQQEDFKQSLSPRGLERIATDLTEISKMTKNPEEVMEAYSSLWKELQQTAVSDAKGYSKILSLLNTYSISSISDLYSIIDNLPNVSNKEELKATLENLLQFIDINFNTEFNLLADNFANSFEDFSKAISNAQKGMNFSDAIKMADSFGMKMSEFQQRGNKYYYTDYMKLADEYLGTQEDIAKYLDDNFDIEAATDDEIEAYKRAQLAREQYYWEAREAYISEGRIADFLESFDKFNRIDIDIYKSQIMRGDFSNLPEEVQSYIQDLVKYYNSINSNISEAFTTSLSEGTQQAIDNLTKEQADFLRGKAGITMLDDNTALFDAAKLSNEELQEWYSIILSDELKLTDEDKTSFLNAIDTKISDKSLVNVLNEIADTYDSFGVETAEELAEAMGMSLKYAKNSGIIKFDEKSRKYSISYDTLITQLNTIDVTADPESYAELQNTINELIKSVADSITEALSGELDVKDAEVLKRRAKDILGIDINFEQTTKGLKISTDQALELLSKLREVDAVSAAIVETALAESFKEANGECKNLFETQKNILKLEGQIAAAGSTATKAAKERLNIYKQISREQMMQSSSYSFMSNVYDPLKGPGTYLQDIITMRDTIEQAEEDGYVDMDKAFAMVEQAYTWAQLSGKSYNILGMTISEDAESLQKAFTAMGQSWVEVDGGLGFDIASIGANFNSDLTKASSDIDSGMKEFAKSQVKMLDGLIAFLEGIVALEELTTSTEGGLNEAFKTLAGPDGVLQFTDIYNEATKDLTTAGKEMIKAIKNLTEEQQNIINQAYKINVNGEEMGLIDWLNLDEGALEADAYKISSMLFAVFSTIGKDWDLTTLNENISNALSDTGMTFSYGKAGGVLFDFLGDEKPVERNVTIHLNIEGMEMADLQQLENVFEHLDLVDENGEVLSGKIGGAEYQLTMGVDGKLHLTIGGKEWGDSFDPANASTTAQQWFSNTINSYIKEKGLKLTVDDFTAISTLLTDDNIPPITGGGSIGFKITYSDDAGTAGTVSLGAIGRRFGPYESYKTAGEAMQAVAEDYNNVYGSGTLSDISLNTKFITITSTSGVEYSFEVDPGTADSPNGLVTAFKEKEGEITSIISSVEEEAKKDDITLTGVTLKSNGNGGYNVELKATDINGTKSLTYNFAVTPPTNEDNDKTRERIKEQINVAVSNLGALIGAANEMPSSINEVELRDNKDGTYTLELETITINGEKTIKYGGLIINGGGKLTESQIARVGRQMQQKAMLAGLGDSKDGLDSEIEMPETTVDMTLKPGDIDASEIEEGVNEAIDDINARKETDYHKIIKTNAIIGTPATRQANTLKAASTSSLPTVKALGDFLSAFTDPENLEGIYNIVSTVEWDNLDDFKAGLQETFGEEMINSLGDSFMPFLYSWYRELSEIYYDYDREDGGFESGVKNWIDNIGDKLELENEHNAYLYKILAMAATSLKWQIPQSESQDNIDDKNKTTSDDQEQTRTVQKAPVRPQRQTTGDKFDDLNTYLSGMSQYFDQMAVYGYWKPGKNAKQANDEANANEETVAELQETNAQLEATTAASEEISSLMNTDPVTWTSLASTELKATVHGDLWGGGNQVVLPDGNGGNLHFNLADYIKAFNAAYSGVQETAEESPVEIPITESGTDVVWEKVRSVVSQINDQKATIKIQAEVNSVNVAVTDENGNPVPTTSGAGKAKGDTAFAKGTLMGELGPELYVTGGHYYVAGQSGAEFVDLPDDAIVFNHLQTQRLLGNGKAGRGKAVTNEKKATSYATGNMAMASASETLSRLKAIRDLWQGILDRGIKELSTAGGGGGGGGKEDDTGFLHELDRWYNLMRQIEKCEQQITYQQKLRENMRKGDDYIKSLEYELALLEKEQSNYRTLANAQREYYLAQMKWLNEESIWGTFFTYDEDGLMQYRSPEIKVLFEAESRNAYGNSKYTSEQQYNLIRNELLAHGFSADIISQYLDYDETGKKLDKVSDKLQNFYDRFDGTIENQDSLYDSYHDYVIKDEETQTKQNEILEEYQELQLNLEQQLLKAIEDREQAIIDKLQDNYDALKDASDKYTNGLSDALNKEKQLYEQDKSDSELAKLQRQLAILQRSGGSASSIRSLQDQINSQMRDRYFEEQQKQIDAIKEASDKELEKMQQQLDVMEETLEYQKNNGLFWSEVTAMMQNWTPSQMADFVQKYTLSWKELSPADVAKNMRETLFEFEKWYEHLHSFGNFNDFYDTEMTKDTLRETYGVDVDDKNALNRARAIAKEAYQKYFVNEDFAKNYKSAEDAARQALLKNKDTLGKQKLDNTTTYNTTGTDTSTGGGGGGGTGPNAQDVLNQWNELMKKFNEAKEMYNNSNSKILSFSEWYKGPIPLDTLMHSPDLREGYDFYKKQYDDYVEAQRKKNIMDAFVDMRTTLNVMRQLLNYYGNSALKGKTLPSYDDGGMIEKTGLVLAHKHEGVLKPEQIDVLRKLTIASGKDSIVYQLAELRDSWEQISVPMANLAATQSNPLTIQNATVNMNVQSIANDYDARRAGQMALDEMVRIARQSSVQNLRR